MATARGKWLPSVFLLHDDRLFRVCADDRADASNAVRGQWREMFDRRHLGLTLACLLLAGLNFSAYQFYSGFITT